MAHDRETVNNKMASMHRHPSVFSSAEEGVPVTDTVPKRFSGCNWLFDSQDVLASIDTEVNVDGKSPRKFVPRCLLVSANSFASWEVCNPRTEFHVVNRPKPECRAGQGWAGRRRGFACGGIKEDVDKPLACRFPQLSA